MIRPVGEIKSIICLHLNQVGDLLFSLPAIHALRTRFPDAHIASVVRQNCADLLMRTGLVDETIVRPKGGISSDIALAMQLRRRKFDLLILFSTSVGMWFVSQLSGARVKAGFTDSLNGLMLDIVSDWSPPPCTANNLRLAEVIGCDLLKKDYVGFIKPSDKDKADAETILHNAGISSDEKFAVIASGTSNGRESKAWSDEGYAGVASELEASLGIRSVVVGVGNASGICGRTTSAVDVCGKTSLVVLAAILAKAELFVGADSGAMHLAAAMDTPVVGLFGPTDHRLTGPSVTDTLSSLRLWSVRLALLVLAMTLCV